MGSVERLTAKCGTRTDTYVLPPVGQGLLSRHDSTPPSPLSPQPNELFRRDGQNSTLRSNEDDSSTNRANAGVLQFREEVKSTLAEAHKDISKLWEAISLVNGSDQRGV